MRRTDCRSLLAAMPSSVAAGLRAAARTRARRPDRGDDAEEQGQPLLHQLPQGRRGGGAASWASAALGRPDRDRPGQAERGGRGLDHPRRGRDRGERREQGGDLAPCCARRGARASRSSPGTPTPSPTPATSSSTRRRREGIGTTLHGPRRARSWAARASSRSSPRRSPPPTRTSGSSTSRRGLAEKYPRHRRWSPSGRATTTGKRAFDETQTLLKVAPRGEADHGHRLAGGAGRGRGGEAVGPARTSRSSASGLPNANKPYVHDGVARLRRPLEHDGPRLPDRPRRPRAGQGHAQARGHVPCTAGRLGTVEIGGDNVLLGTPFTFTKDNIDQFDF